VHSRVKITVNDAACIAQKWWSLTAVRAVSFPDLDAAKNGGLRVRSIHQILPFQLFASNWVRFAKTRFLVLDLLGDGT
jgi:hypothetical protein